MCLIVDFIKLRNYCLVQLATRQAVHVWSTALACKSSDLNIAYAYHLSPWFDFMP